VSGRNKEAPAARYQHTDYTHLQRPLIPHGISVCLTAPAVFRLTAHASPRRHAEAARALGVDVPTVREADADYVGRALGDRILQLMQTLRVPLGLAACGFGAADLPALVAGTLPQARITRLAHIKNQEAVDAALLEELFRQSMKY
jgi:hydroxyacid-oxoacid transhydrogenase